MPKCAICEIECGDDTIRADGKPVCSPSHAQAVLDKKREQADAEARGKELAAQAKAREKTAEQEKKLGEENDKKQKEILKQQAAQRLAEERANDTKIAHSTHE